MEETMTDTIGAARFAPKTGDATVSRQASSMDECRSTAPLSAARRFFPAHNLEDAR
jgi:hypothetical protein